MPECRTCHAPLMGHDDEVDRLLRLLDRLEPLNHADPLVMLFEYRIDLRREAIKTELRTYHVPREQCRVCREMEAAADTPYLRKVTETERALWNRLHQN